MNEYTICTKCFRGESGENLSRFCTRCNYMRLIKSEGKDEAWEKERNSGPWTEKEIEFLDNIMDKNAEIGRAFIERKNNEQGN